MLTLILQKLPVTIQLATAAMIVALVIGLPAGVIAAVRKGTAVDYAASAFALSGLSIPNFWLGIMLILVVAVQLKWLPASGYASIFEDPVAALQTLAMRLSFLARGWPRSSCATPGRRCSKCCAPIMWRTARAKGLNENRVILKHALRNALIPSLPLRPSCSANCWPVRC